MSASGMSGAGATRLRLLELGRGAAPDPGKGLCPLHPRWGEPPQTGVILGTLRGMGIRAKPSVLTQNVLVTSQNWFRTQPRKRSADFPKNACENGETARHQALAGAYPITTPPAETHAGKLLVS